MTFGVSCEVWERVKRRGEMSTVEDTKEHMVSYVRAYTHTYTCTYTLVHTHTPITHTCKRNKTPRMPL